MEEAEEQEEEQEEQEEQEGSGGMLDAGFRQQNTSPVGSGSNYRAVLPDDKGIIGGLTAKV